MISVMLIYFCSLIVSGSALKPPLHVKTECTGASFTAAVTTSSGDIIAASVSQIFRLQPTTGGYYNFTLEQISGSSSARGQSRAGVGTSDQFNTINDLLDFNKTHALVSDKNCLWLVELIPGNPTRYAGNCTQSGLVNGFRLSSKFNQNIGITKVDDVIFICDQNNDVLRKIDNDMVSTLELKINIRPRFIEYMSGRLYVTATKAQGRDNHIYQVDPSTEEIQQFAASFSQSYPNRMLQKIIALDTRTFLISDKDNNTVVVLDAVTSDHYTICGAVNGYKDGNRTACYLSNPRALTVHQDEIFIGDWNTFRTILLYSIIENRSDVITNDPTQTISSVVTTQRSDLNTTFHSSETTLDSENTSTEPADKNRSDVITNDPTQTISSVVTTQRSHLNTTSHSSETTLDSENTSAEPADIVNGLDEVYAITVIISIFVIGVFITAAIKVYRAHCFGRPSSRLRHVNSRGNSRSDENHERENEEGNYYAQAGAYNSAFDKEELSDTEYDHISHIDERLNLDDNYELPGDVADNYDLPGDVADNPLDGYLTPDQNLSNQLAKIGRLSSVQDATYDEAGVIELINLGTYVVDVTTSEKTNTESEGYDYVIDPNFSRVENTTPNISLNEKEQTGAGYIQILPITPTTDEQGLPLQTTGSHQPKKRNRTL